MEDKINAIFDMLPLIKEAYNICQFMLENRWFNTAYKGYMDRESDKLKKDELFTVLDYYWIPHKEEKNIEVLYEVIYRDQKHIDIICKYLALEWIAYERSSFILKIMPNEERKQEWYKPRTNPQHSNWTP